MTRDSDAPHYLCRKRRQGADSNYRLRPGTAAASAIHCASLPLQELTEASKRSVKSLVKEDTDGWGLSSTCGRDFPTDNGLTGLGKLLYLVIRECERYFARDPAVVACNGMSVGWRFPTEHKIA